MALDETAEYTRVFAALGTRLRDRTLGYHGHKKWNRSQLDNPGRPPLQLLHDYRTGNIPLDPSIAHQWADATRQVIRMGRLNMADLVVSSVTNRMNIIAMQTVRASDLIGDAAAEEIMFRTGYRKVYDDIHTNMLTMGIGYGLTSVRDGQAWFTSEDPRWTITAHDPVTRQETAGLIMFRSEDDTEDLAFIHLPGEVWAVRKPGRSTLSNRRWKLNPEVWSLVEDEPAVVPGGRVALVAFENRDGHGEFEKHLDSIDRLNDKIFHEWWTGKVQAFRQRAIKGLPDTVDEFDEEGNITEREITAEEWGQIFTMAPDEIWRMPEGSEFWESQTVDLSPLLASTEKERLRLAGSTTTPLHIVAPDAAQGSAEGAALLREEHVMKILNRQGLVAHAHAKMFSNAFLFQGDEERARVEGLRPVWGPAERHSLSDKASAASQLKGILPRTLLLRDVLQYTPSEAEAAIAQLARDALVPGPDDVKVPIPDPAGSPIDGDLGALDGR